MLSRVPCFPQFVVIIFSISEPWSPGSVFIFNYRFINSKEFIMTHKRVLSEVWVALKANVSWYNMCVRVCRLNGSHWSFSKTYVQAKTVEGKQTEPKTEDNRFMRTFDW